MPPMSAHILRAASRVRRLIIAFTCAALLALIALLVWARQVAVAAQSARFALDSDDAVIVTRNEWVAFRPRDVDPSIGVLFYPGGRAEPVAYAPILRSLAMRGYLIVMTPMPLNVALFAPERARRVPPRFPEIRTWVIAGHSVGGVMAAEFAERFPEEISGLVLWASYPADFTDLSQRALPVLSVYGTADALTTAQDIERTRSHLPVTTRYVPLDGGGHWQFGHFARRDTATVSREVQQELVLDATAEFLDSLAGSSQGGAAQGAPARRSDAGRR